MSGEFGKIQPEGSEHEETEITEELIGTQNRASNAQGTVSAGLFRVAERVLDVETRGRATAYLAATFRASAATS